MTRARNLFIAADEILVIVAPQASDQTMAFAGPLSLEDALKHVRGYDTFEATKFLRVNWKPSGNAQFERPEDVTEDMARAWLAADHDREEWVDEVFPPALVEDENRAADRWNDHRAAMEIA